jgi:hypothetical protein
MYHFSVSPSGLSQQGQETLQASYIIQQQAPVVSANKGARHCRQAKSMVAAMQKGVDGMAAQPCQNGVNRRFFSSRKATARGVNLDTIIDALAYFEAKKQMLKR